MTLWSWSRIFGAPIDRVVDPAPCRRSTASPANASNSIYDLMLRRSTAAPLERKFLAVSNFYTVEPWRSLMASNSPGPLPPSIPLFLAQGGADELGAAAGDAGLYAAAMPRRRQECRCCFCRRANHGFIARDAAASAVDWMTDRFAGASGAERLQSRLTERGNHTYDLYSIKNAI